MQSGEDRWLYQVSQLGLDWFPQDPWTRADWERQLRESFGTVLDRNQGLVPLTKADKVQFVKDMVDDIFEEIKAGQEKYNKTRKKYALAQALSSVKANGAMDGVVRRQVRRSGGSDGRTVSARPRAKRLSASRSASRKKRTYRRKTVVAKKLTRGISKQQKKIKKVASARKKRKAT